MLNTNDSGVILRNYNAMKEQNLHKMNLNNADALKNSQQEYWAVYAWIVRLK